MMVFQVIERAGNRGIWTRDIKSQTNIQQQTLTKALRLLENRQLIKSVKAVTSKSKKLYMLFDVVPAKEITGGPWYTEHEFDHQFIEELCKFVHAFVKKEKMASLPQITERVRVSGISNVELAEEEVGQIVKTLLFDGKLEEISASVTASFQLKGSSGDFGPRYKVGAAVSSLNYLTDVPCGVCPVVDQCSEGAVISPSTCTYMTKWLGLPDDLDW